MEDASGRARRSVEPYAQQKSTGGRRSRSGPASAAACISRVEAVAERTELGMGTGVRLSPEGGGPPPPPVFSGAGGRRLPATCDAREEAVLNQSRYQEMDGLDWVDQTRDLSTAYWSILT
jgi:hypothetical protein